MRVDIIYHKGVRTTDRRTVDASYYSKGQQITAKTTAQGMKAGQKYMVTNVIERPTPFGNFVEYELDGKLKVVNLHLLADAAMKDCGCGGAVQDAQEIGFFGYTIVPSQGRYFIYTPGTNPKSGRSWGSAASLEAAKETISRLDALGGTAGGRSSRDQDAATYTQTEYRGALITNSVMDRENYWVKYKGRDLGKASSMQAAKALIDAHLSKTDDGSHAAGCDCAGCSNGVRG